MSNRASTQLHEIIHSLSSAEKRYFKLYAKRHRSKSKKNYLLLFDEIGKQKTYDEEKLLKTFAGNSLTRHFAITKNRLYHQVLKSLDAFYSQATVDAELNQYIHFAEILFNKSLYNQCGRIINTAKRLAQKHEKWPHLLQILKWQKRLIEVDNYENSALNPKSLFMDESEVLEKIKHESKLWHTKSKIFTELFAKGQARTAREAEKLESEIDKTTTTHNSPRSFEASYLANHIKSAFYFATVNYKKCHNALKRNAELIEQNIEMVRDEPSTYISVLTNLIYVSAKLNKFKDADDYLNKLRDLPPSLKKRLSENLELRIFTNTYSLELAICNLTGNVNRGMELIRVC